MVNVADVNIKISTEARKAIVSLDKMSKSLKEVSKNIKGLDKIKKPLENASTAAKKFTTSFNVAKLYVALRTIKELGRVIGSFVKESNFYVENLNLFNVAMGDAAEGAKAFIDTLAGGLGIDPGEALRYQGFFQQLSTGLGIANDSATIMSRNLTQLGYDISSFFNIDIQDAMLKLQSGLAGELEPLRRIGFSLSIATLETLAFSLGIKESVRDMTDAKKAQLRYIAIINQSSNAQGDMARTLMTPANMMRILGEQVRLASRAIGNIFIPALQKILPIAIAVTKVVAELATTLALFFGFELPKIDYSTVGGGLAATSGSLDDIGDSADDAKKKIKTLTAGFDELNVISEGTDTGAGAGVGLGLGADGLGIDLGAYQYDALLGLMANDIDEYVGRIKNKLNELREKFEEFKPILVGIGGLIGTAFAVIGITNLIKIITRLKGSSKILKTFARALDWSRASFLLAKDPLLALSVGFTSLWISLKTFLKGLSPFVKMAIAIGGLITVFLNVSSAIEDFMTGTSTMGTLLLNTIPIIGLVGTAMFAIFGVGGIAITAIVATIGFLYGLNEAQEELQRDFIEETFFDGVGESLDAFNGYLTDSYDEMGKLNDKIAAYDTAMENNQTIMDNSTVVLENYKSILSSTGSLTEDELTSMKNNFNDLATAVEENFNYRIDLVFTAFQKVSEDTASKLGIDIGEITGILEGFRRNFSTITDGLQTDVDKYFSLLASGDVLTPEQEQDFYDKIGLLSQLSGKVSENQVAFQQQLNDIGQIDFGDVDSATDKIIEIGDAGKALLDEIDSTFTTTSAAISSLQEDLDILFDAGQITESQYTAYSSAVGQAFTLATAEKNSAIESVNKDMSAIFGAIGLALDNQTEQLSKDYRDSLINNLSENNKNLVQAIADDLGVTFNEAFNIVSKDLALNSKVIKETITDPIGDILSETASDLGVIANKELGRNLMEGLSNGITDNTWLAADSITNSMQEVEDAAREQARTHSPSLAYKDIGKDLMDGLKEGIEEHSGVAITAMSNLFSTLLGDLNSFQADFNRDLSSFVTDVNRTISKLKTKLKNATSDLTGVDVRMSVNGFADGGLPNQGEMFIAREAGPEMVGSIGGNTAVANNDQIVTAISKGVYEAMIASQGSGEEKILVHSVLELDGNVVYENQKEIKRNRGVDLGMGVYKR